MNRLIPILLVGSALSACMSAYDRPAPEAAPAVAEQMPEEAAQKAAWGTFGIDTTGMDTEVDPGDDFYEFVNGEWTRTTEIPADVSNYGIFSILSDLSDERTRTIVEEQAADPASRIGKAYRAYLDTDRINALGLSPIAPWLDRIEKIETFDDYAVVTGHADRIGVSGAPISASVGIDSGNSSKYIMTVFQSGLGMPDRDYYLQDSERFRNVRAAYVDYLANMLTLSGADDAAARAQAILDYETKLAGLHWDRNEAGDNKKTYNVMSYEELKALAPQFNWDAFTAESGISAERLNVGTPSSIAEGVALAAQTPVGVLKDILTVRSLSSFASALPEEVDNLNFSFFGTTISGIPQQQERWKRAIGFVSTSLRDDVGKIYVERHFNAETKAEMRKLVDNVIDAMGARIRNADWMAETTKVEAQAKLNKFTAKIGYPDVWMDYAGLEMVDGDAFGNMVRSRVWSHEDSLGILDGPVRKWAWGMAPMTVNAYANFSRMEVVFPASILQAPYFDPNADPAVNYGSIGAVIGHEISHHFDDQGAKYDSEGNLVDWWTEEDYANFNARGKALIEQYNQYEIFPGEFIDGEFTLGENIGDIAGLAIAYDAYKASLNGKEAPVIDGYSGDQRFYMSWSQSWRRRYRENELRNRLKTDVHAPSIQRTWIVRNIDAWYDAFGVTPDDAMYLPPEERVKVW